MPGVSNEAALLPNRILTKGCRVLLTGQFGTVTRVSAATPVTWVDVQWDGGWSKRIKGVGLENMQVVR